MILKMIILPKKRRAHKQAKGKSRGGYNIQLRYRYRILLLKKPVCYFTLDLKIDCLCLYFSFFSFFSYLLLCFLFRLLRSRRRSIIKISSIRKGVHQLGHSLLHFGQDQLIDSLNSSSSSRGSQVKQIQISCY